MQPEIDKIQLEIAKLQLERERRRHEAADTLKRGATAAGSTIGSALKWVMWVVLGAVLGGAAGWIVAAVWSVLRHDFQCRGFPDADFLFSVGCIVGADQLVITLTALTMVIIGAVVGHLHYREKAGNR